ncbi:hypothetical protein Tco_0568770 [Tanacetum coccineum]
MLPVAPARAESELDASVERFFDEGGSGNQTEQGDFAVGGGCCVTRTRGEKEFRSRGYRWGFQSSQKIERRSWDPGLDLYRCASQRFVISSDSSHHSGPAIAEAKIDSFVTSSVPFMMAVTTVTLTVDLAVVAKEKTVKPSLFIPVTISHNRLNQ